MNFFELKENLLSLGYSVKEFDTKNDASDYLCDVIVNKSVGIGGSVTVEEMNLIKSLSLKNKVITHIGISDKNEQDILRKKASNTDIYISSVNAISINGEIINIDNTGNRVANILYGHEKVYLIVGENKIENDYESALYRARNVAAPLNSRRLNKKTPCAIKGDKCYNCKCDDRICRVFSVLWEAPLGCSYEIILIHEKLGY